MFHLRFIKQTHVYDSCIALYVVFTILPLIEHALPKTNDEYSVISIKKSTTNSHRNGHAFLFPYQRLWEGWMEKKPSY
jgi:hypothetical protein